MSHCVQVVHDTTHHRVGSLNLSNEKGLNMIFFHKCIMNLKCNLCDLAFYKHVSIVFIMVNNIHVVMDHFVLSIENTHLFLHDVSF